MERVCIVTGVAGGESSVGSSPAVLPALSVPQLTDYPVTGCDSISLRFVHGFDLVFVPVFQTQLEQPGTTLGRVFSDREWSQAHSRPLPMVSLAARWAAKEAFVKAWSSTFTGRPSPIDKDEFVWSEVELLSDRFHRPYFFFNGAVAKLLSADLDCRRWSWAVSLSHDGDYAAASVIGSTVTTISNGDSHS